MDEIREAYTRWSGTYDTDRNRTRDLDADVTRRVLAELPRPDTVVELGCGTGKNTVFLAEIARSRVLALDFSDGMLARAREKVAAIAPEAADRVTFAVADVARPPWPGAGDASADLVVCNLVLEHVADLAPVFAGAARVLRPGGAARMFVCELHPFRQYQGTRARFGEEGGAGGAEEIPAFVHHVSEFTEAARARGLSLLRLNEWWHAEDENRPPRLVSFLFGKG